MNIRTSYLLRCAINADPEFFDKLGDGSLDEDTVDAELSARFEDVYNNIIAPEMRELQRIRTMAKTPTIGCSLTRFEEVLPFILLLMVTLYLSFEILSSWAATPTVYMSHSSQQCVTVVNYKNNDKFYNCENLPPKYSVNWTE